MTTAPEPAPQPRATIVQICRLHFSDRQSVSATIQPRFPTEECEIHYSGVAERLPYRYGTADMVLLRALFKSFARELRARFDEEITGAWEPAPAQANGATPDLPAEAG